MLTHTSTQPGYATVSGGTTSRYTGYPSRRPSSLDHKTFWAFLTTLHPTVMSLHLITTCSAFFRCGSF